MSSGEGDPLIVVLQSTRAISYLRAAEALGGNNDRLQYLLQKTKKKQKRAIRKLM